MTLTIPHRMAQQSITHTLIHTLSTVSLGWEGTVSSNTLIPFKSLGITQQTVVNVNKKFIKGDFHFVAAALFLASFESHQPLKGEASFGLDSDSALMWCY